VPVAPSATSQPLLAIRAETGFVIAPVRCGGW
jgi:hypothetical protein